MSEQKQVTIYSTPSCHFCHQTKEFFKENDIEFTDHNVAEDAEKRAEMVEKSGQMGVPVTDIDGEIIVGFDKNKLIGWCAPPPTPPAFSLEQHLHGFTQQVGIDLGDDTLLEFL